MHQSTQDNNNNDGTTSTAKVSSNISTGAQGVFEINASLVEIDNNRANSMCHLVILQVVPTTLRAGATWILHCSIDEHRNSEEINHSSSTAPSPFYEGPIVIYARNEHTSTVIRTSTITAARHKIVLSTSSDWTSVWYKDEGGRDKCLTIMAAVCDHLHQHLQPTPTVPLQLTLCYAAKVAPVPVGNQDIMRIIGSNSHNRVELDPATGVARIRFRVDDVSKNHQGQDFCLKVSANQIAAPGITPPITIRSKRNKRNRHSVAENNVSANILTLANHGGGSRAHATQQLEQQNQQNKLVRLQEALDGIEQWAKSVVSRLYPLQWQVVGYAQDPRTGNTDYNRPYHTNMVNPNSQIARILETYNCSTRQQLQLLRQTLESSSERIPSGAYSNSGIDRPFGTEYTLPPPHHQPQIGYSTYPMMRNLRSNTSRACQVEPLQSPSQRQLDCTPRSNLGHEEFSSTSSPAVTDIRVERSNGAILVKKQIEELSSDDDLQHDDEPSIGEEVEYLLAKQFKSVKTSERLGFPVYSADKELLGFYQESGSFVPIPSDFGPTEKLQAVRILETAHSAAVYAKQGRNIITLLNHALVYEWSQGLSYSEECGRSSRQGHTTSSK